MEAARRTRHGGGGRGKGVDQGEHAPAKHTPDAVPDKWYAKCAGTCATGCSKEQEREIQFAHASHHCRTTQGVFLKA